MMTREEVSSIVTYCQVNKITFAQRLKELGVPPWKFYLYKSAYAKESLRNGHTEFVQITKGGEYLPAAPLESTRGAKSRESVSTNKMIIEMRMPNGVLLRAQGEMDAQHLIAFVQTATANVQPQ